MTCDPERHGYRPAEVVEEVDPTPFLDILDERFGIDRACFEGFLVHRPNRDTVWIVDRELRVPKNPEPYALGMPFFYPKMRFPRPTTSAAQRFGHLATRCVVEISDDELPSVVFRRPLEASAERLERAAVDSHGYVLLRHAGATLCLGFADPTAGTITSLCPREWTTRLGFEPPPKLPREVSDGEADAEQRPEPVGGGEGGESSSGVIDE